MGNILSRIVTNRKKQIDALKLQYSIADFEKIISDRDPPPCFYKAISKEGINIIAEVKRASPSKGIISENFDYIHIARQYENGGAAAISVLTEPTFFKGDIRYLEEISSEVALPVLCKDFVIELIQIYQARAIGGSAILLIADVLSKHQLREFIRHAHDVGLSCLVEVHNERQAYMALESGGRAIGVNNRNLETFEVDLAVSERLRTLIPGDRIFISESGIHTREDMERLERIGVNGVLIGESLMRARNIADKLAELRGVTGGNDED
mgnify:CR=1 FL=1